MPMSPRRVLTQGALVRAISLCLLAILAFLAVLLTPTQLPRVEAAPLDYEPALERTLFDLMNPERAARGLHALQHNATLQAVARIRSWDMANRGYFSHYTAEGLSAFDMLDGLGMSRRNQAENIGYNYLDSSRSADSAIRMFMGSPPHAAAILNGRFRYGGIGEVTNSAGARYYTMLFSE